MDSGLVIPESERLVMPRGEAHTPVDDHSAQAVPLPGDVNGIWLREHRHVNLCTQLDRGMIAPVPN